MMKLVRRFLIIITFIVIVGILGFWVVYNTNIGCVDKKNTDVIRFDVKDGSNFYNIGSSLKKEGLIKSEFFYKLYIKLNKPNHIQTGIYELNKTMDVEDIVKTLQGKSINPNELSITFKEGYDMKDIIKVITSKTNNTEEDILNKLKDTEYLTSLINKYWFIDESILNSEIYYSLEGYLYPETYRFKDKDVSIEEIFNTMIEQLNIQLERYKSDIEQNSYTPHQLLTLSSIVELESLTGSDRAGVAGVFYNRLNANMNLGSDVTTYYAAGVEMGERDLYMDEITDNNAYNTRSNSMAGKLPIGPICNPSIESIGAVIHPSQHDYYYFVSDKNGKTYFSKNSTDHNNTISKLKQEGLWYEY